MRWTPQEDAILTRVYPAAGPAATVRALARAGHHRGEGATRARAHALGLRHRGTGSGPTGEPTCGPRPAPRPAWSIWPPTFTDILDIHPELALAFTNQLHDDWRPVAPR